MTESQPWSTWIDSEIVHTLWKDGLERCGGLRSTPKDGCIDGALGNAYTAELYSMPEVEDETAISGLCFCGYLLFYLSTAHCWSDGNKRVAWASAMWALYHLGLTIKANDEEVISYCMQIADGQIKKGEDVVNWIAERLVELEATD
jgi:prophage maintenance system killer protein